jgi:gamma-glutamyltranspeptidase/glutathione hydrolase
LPISYGRFGTKKLKIGVEIMKKAEAFDAMVNLALCCLSLCRKSWRWRFMVYRKANGEIGTLDYREKAPLSPKRHVP